MAVLVRIVMVIVAYVLACIAASLVLTIGTLTPEWDDLASLGLQSAAVWTVIMVGAAVIATIAMLPTLLVICARRRLSGWRSILLYGGARRRAGAGPDLWPSTSAGYAGEPGSYLAREREVLAAAGIAGGLVYWLFAGRKAGIWK